MNKEEELQETINRINRLYMDCRQSKRSLSRRLNECLRRERINNNKPKQAPGGTPIGGSKKKRRIKKTKKRKRKKRRKTKKRKN